MHATIDIIPPPPKEGRDVTIMGPLEFTMLAIAVVLAMSFAVWAIRRANDRLRQAEEQHKQRIVEDYCKFRKNSGSKSATGSVSPALMVGAGGCRRLPLRVVRRPSD